MRLIDVDDLIEYFDGDLEGYDNREYILHMLDSKGRSARVEAIPIDWIKKHIEASKHLTRQMTEYEFLQILLDDWYTYNKEKSL